MLIYREQPGKADVYFFMDYINFYVLPVAAQKRYIFTFIYSSSYFTGAVVFYVPGTQLPDYCIHI